MDIREALKYCFPDHPNLGVIAALKGEASVTLPPLPVQLGLYFI